MASASDQFATPRVAAGVLFRDPNGRALLVKPTYKTGWDLPGGYVETGESPLAAAIREVREELGLEVAPTELIVLDWAPHPHEGDKLLAVFDGGTLTESDLERVRLADGEIAEVKFAGPDELADLLSDRLLRRVREALAQPSSHYLERGEVPAQSVRERVA